MTDRQPVGTLNKATLDKDGTNLASTIYVLIPPFSSAPKHDSKFVNLTSLISNDHPLQRNIGDNIQ